MGNKGYLCEDDSDCMLAHDKVSTARQVLLMIAKGVGGDPRLVALRMLQLLDENDKFTLDELPGSIFNAVEEIQIG